MRQTKKKTIMILTLSKESIIFDGASLFLLWLRVGGDLIAPEVDLRWLEVRKVDAEVLHLSVTEDVAVVGKALYSRWLSDYGLLDDGSQDSPHVGLLALIIELQVIFLEVLRGSQPIVGRRNAGRICQSPLIAMGPSVGNHVLGLYSINIDGKADEVCLFSEVADIVERILIDASLLKMVGRENSDK
jgi:hypothetical protein